MSISGATTSSGADEGAEAVAAASARLSSDPMFAAYEDERRTHWDGVARKLDSWTGWGGGYHERLARIYGFLAPPGQRVLELGCGRGDLLAALHPSYGIGIDLSHEMIERAKHRHPQLTFVQADAHLLPDLGGPFDVIVLSDLANDIFDLQTVLEQIAGLCHARTRVILNTYSRVWEGPLALASRTDLATPSLYQNWFTVEDVASLMGLVDFEVIRRWPEILWPVRTPILDALCNRFLVKLWPFRWFALTNFVVARPRPRPPQGRPPVVSVIVPARNEAGNIVEILERTPEMGGGTEIVFVEGHSSDDTFATIEREVAARPTRRCQVHRQTGVGKGDAVRLGFAEATGDVLMILDADLTVPPEDLPRFYSALWEGKGDFINGVRLVYPMEDEAMRFFNLLGNKFFSMAFSWLLGQSVKDTLCGTKVLLKSDYEGIVANRSYFGDFDPFGDFDLLFGAARLGLRIEDLPVRYRARRYGTTNIQRWRHGWLLLRMVAFAARRIKFV